MKVQNPHDKYFKETMGNVSTAKDFLTNYLPENIMGIIDVNTLEPQKDSYINKELEDSYSDLLFKVDINEREGYLYFLFEHKSYEDKGIAFQLLKYMIEIWEAKAKKENAKELPIIIPLVIHHGRSNWRILTNLGAVLNGYELLPDELRIYVPNFEYLIYDLTTYGDEDIKGEAQTRILLTLFRDIFTKDRDGLLQSVFRSIHYLNELEDRQSGLEYFETMMRYIFSAVTDLTEKDAKKIIEQLETTYLEGSEIAMTLADKWRDEGMKAGMQAGMEKGAAVALSEAAIQMLIEKFGKVPQDIKDDIVNSDTATLKLLLVNGFKFQEIDDARRYIQ
ncbi:hypothetical protein HMPREF9372_1226 [Sporosarcina newyorkensis 2681]|uniref:Transposase (putative) YhgA-like domain-containing protein n=1 Tax=Sporosarcina newyorkensis 2681 TaxID=1027292 RepID=F9DQZ6_9BACL|nr:MULTISPECIES: Rpn family recombination-promoting nuclease/putative transposase [Sporosarcina]EGQ26768.1 hypothetical protein HMPREF9372_1226 [Sporosarcina newyorkensis 2681]MBY0221649.1 Rpn family recombination-promoting nuclease/putative transposase [Sporosarcina aquimarina]